MSDTPTPAQVERAAQQYVYDICESSAYDEIRCRTDSPTRAALNVLIRQSFMAGAKWRVKERERTADERSRFP